MRLLSLRCLINARLELIKGLAGQTEKSVQLNDVVNIFLVNDVLNVVNELIGIMTFC